MEANQYRLVLKDALGNSSQSGQAYSIRGFAEKIGVSNSYLSEVLNGRKSLSVELAFKICVKLGFTELETQRFCMLVQLDQENDPAFRREIQERLRTIDQRGLAEQLSADHFQLIADWHHFAILELTHVAGFRADPAYIAEKLGISRREAEEAVARLKRLSLLGETKAGDLVKNHDQLESVSAVPVEAFKQFHAQILEKATAALAAQKPGERLSATDIIPLDSRQMAQVDRLSREFSAAVSKLSAKAKTKDQVYALSVHCFRVTRKE